MLVGCGVPTGWCSAVYAADVDPGETVIIYGIGGIGANAVQGANHAGAANIIAVDPLANKREIAEDLGATHTVASAEEAHELAQELTTRRRRRQGDHHRRHRQREVVGQAAVDAIRKGGTAVITGLADPNKLTVQLSGADHDALREDGQGHAVRLRQPDARHHEPDRPLPGGQAQARRAGHQHVHARRHQPGLPDMLDGKNIRGVVVHEH